MEIPRSTQQDERLCIITANSYLSVPRLKPTLIQFRRNRGGFSCGTKEGSWNSLSYKGKDLCLNHGVVERTTLWESGNLCATFTSDINWVCKSENSPPTFRALQLHLYDERVWLDQHFLNHVPQNIWHFSASRVTTSHLWLL